MPDSGNGTIQLGNDPELFPGDLALASIERTILGKTDQPGIALAVRGTLLIPLLVTVLS